MPAPSPSITAITVANAGRSSGAASAASRIWPTITPISAPASVTAIAASERNSRVSRMIAIATPISSPTGAVCSEARSIRMPRSATLDAVALGGLGRLDERLAVRLLELLGLEVVADRHRGQPAVARDRPALGERVLNLLDALEVADLVERSGDRGARLGVGDLALVDGEDQRRVGAREGGAVLLEEVERLLGLRARDVEVVGRLAARAGGDTEQHHDGDRAGQAALPVLREGAGDPREQGRHGFSERCVTN